MKKILLILSVAGWLLSGCAKEPQQHMVKDYQYKFVCVSEFASVFYQVNSERKQMIQFYISDTIRFETLPGDTIKVTVYTDYPTVGVLYENQTEAVHSTWSRDDYHTMTYIAK